MLNLGLKGLFVGLLAFGAFSGLDRFEGKAFGEYFAFIRGGDELATAYTDTLGDEILGLSGAALAGLTVAYVARRRSGRAW